MRLIVVVGARPNFVKIGPLLPGLESAGHNVRVAFTGSREMSRSSTGNGEVSFYGVTVRSPDWFLDVGAGTDGVQTGRALIALEELFARERPDAVMVVGDVNSTLAGAVAAAKLQIPVIHLEAGLRCGSMKVPEEVNRTLITRVTAMHLAPSEEALGNLAQEGVPAARSYFVGNLMAESVLRHIDEIRKLDAASPFGLEKGAFAIASFHRPENLTDPARVCGIIQGLDSIGMPVLCPDTGALGLALRECSVSHGDSVMVVDAVGYREMLALLRDAVVVLTDSGGVQEEACMVGTPCVTVRACTEHVSTIEVGANRLCDATADSMGAAVKDALSARRGWVAPKRWDKAVSERVVRALRQPPEPLA